MQPKKLKTPYCFFAAANGYNGFQNCFSEVFDAELFDRIFILKGGPGTGKSSLLRGIANAYFEKGVYVEAIFCSSDPDSLDGVILEKDLHRVAILDGTAPHERDAYLAGCAEELVDLGKFWDEAQLCKHRYEIQAIQKRKSDSYRKGYDHLAISGVFDRKIEAEIKRVQHDDVYEEGTFALLERLDKREGKRSRRLLSCFGRYGHLTLPTAERLAKTVFVPKGLPIQRELFLSHLERTLAAEGCRMLVFPSPLAQERIEGLFFQAESVAVLAHPTDPENALPLFWNDPLPDLVHREVCDLEEYRSQILRISQRHFADAATAHFELERIYTAAMDFTKNDALSLALMKKIDNILQRS